jgi:hypothetical protein
MYAKKINVGLDLYGIIYRVNKFKWFCHEQDISINYS